VAATTGGLGDQSSMLLMNTGAQLSPSASSTPTLTYGLPMPTYGLVAEKCAGA
jgi:hypothetical protein